MRRIFRDDLLESEFKKQGFVLVNMLDEDAIEVLKTFYLEQLYSNEVLPSFFCTHYSKNRKFKRAEAAAIRNAFSDESNKFLIDFDICLGSGMIKKSNDAKSVVPLHADWSFVDESKCESLSLWCPLIDTNKDNGTIGVVPTSHTIIETKRGPKIPSCFNQISSVVIDNYGKLIDMKAGEVLIYDQRLWHYSNANKSNQDRIAVHIDLAPKEAQVVHYCILNNEEKITQYNVQSNDFFLEYDYYEKPDMGVNPIYIDNTNIRTNMDVVHEHFGVKKPLESKKSIWGNIKEYFINRP